MKKFHLSKVEVNAMMKRVKNSDTLQTIASLALGVANKDKMKLKAQID